MTVAFLNCHTVRILPQRMQCVNNALFYLACAITRVVSYSVLLLLVCIEAFMSQQSMIKI